MFWLDTCTLGVHESVFSILLCCLIAGTKDNVMANLEGAICRVEDGEIIAALVETLTLLLGNNWMICCSVKLNRTITGFQWLLVHKQRQCVGYMWWKVNCFWKFLFHPIFGETVQLFSFWQKLCSTKSDFLVSPTKQAILLVDPFYTTTFTLLDLQLHIFLVIRAIYHTKDLLLTHKISTFKENTKLILALIDWYL